MLEYLKGLDGNCTEYQSVPFWSWNDKLEPEKLTEQIDWMYQNGIGGFFMHARGGLRTEYMSEDWMQCVDACVPPRSPSCCRVRTASTSGSRLSSLSIPTSRLWATR